MLSKQDQTGVRTPEDVLRRINLSELNEALKIIDKIRGKMLIDTQLSITSSLPVENKVITQALNNKVNAVDGKGLSTNDFTDDYKSKLNTKIIDLLPNFVSSMEVINAIAVLKNNRVCIDFIGMMDFVADTETIILNLPESIIPPTSKSFIVIADSVIGYGVIDNLGNVTLKFPNQVTNTIVRFSITYDLEEVNI